MEQNNLSELVEESINLELNAAELYKLFSKVLPEDDDFWWQLHIEEKSHATLLRAARDSFLNRNKFPEDMIASSIEDLKASNAKVRTLINRCKTNPPDRHEACRIAVDLEQQSGEMHYSQFMTKDPESSVETVFQQLNRGDKDHEDRIKAHCLSIGYAVKG